MTLSHTNVSGSTALTNFPVLFSVTDPNLKTVANGGSVGKVDGSDILFTAADGLSKLNHEIESYNGATGQVAAWVQVPSLSPSADTVLYVYYGNASASDQQSKAATWNGFAGVWHMNNAAAPALDSTANLSPAAVSHGAPAFGVAGQIDKGVGFNGAGDKLTANGAGMAGSTTATWSGWINWGDFSNENIIGSLGPFGSLRLEGNNGGGYTAWGPAILVTLSLNGQTNTQWAPAPSLNTWHYVSLVADISQPASGEMKLYIDGQAQPLQTYAGNNGNNTGTFSNETVYFGGWIYDWFYGNGKLNEVRLTPAARSSDWVLTEYRNQSSPGTFFAVGAQQ